MILKKMKFGPEQLNFNRMLDIWDRFGSVGPILISGVCPYKLSNNIVDKLFLSHNSDFNRELLYPLTIQKFLSKHYHRNEIYTILLITNH